MTHDCPANAAALLHLLEPVRVGARNGEGLATRSEGERDAAGQVARRRRDVRDVDDGAAMHLPEARRIELLGELLQRRADQRLALRGEYARVLVVRLEITHVVDADEPHVLT